MRSTQQFSITLPNEMAKAVRAKVAGGQYATESEVIRDGLRALLARDQAVEDWRIQAPPLLCAYDYFLVQSTLRTMSSALQS